MQLAADASADPLIREAIALNAFEERRHKEVLENMIGFHGIRIVPDFDPKPPPDPEWAFLQTGYGEAFESFFAFGLFKVARDSGNRSTMTMDGDKSMGISLSPRAFFELCLAENDRRLGCYDARLLKPRFMPALARLALPFLGKA